ncbi:MAG: hypothetical protein MUE69_13495 [Myxococcota bacterium]|nr:hypothetical protein [Myxococcota bacterium]
MTQPSEPNPASNHAPSRGPSRAPTDDELDPELAALLASVDDEPDPSEVDALYGGVRGHILAAKASPVERLRARPTWLRRLLGVLVFLFVVGITTGTQRRADLAAYPLAHLLAYLGSLATLIAVCTFAALRPLHRPSLPKLMGIGLGLLAIGATVVLAIVPDFHTHAPLPTGGLLAHASPCFVYGFLVGAPIYAALRVLGGVDHLVVGHAGVVALYVLGVLALEWALRPRT